jgi:hypothetical protein
LPEGTAEQVREWTEDEEVKVREREEFSPAMKVHECDPTPIREVMGR